LAEAISNSTAEVANRKLQRSRELGLHQRDAAAGRRDDDALAWDSLAIVLGKECLGRQPLLQRRREARSELLGPGAWTQAADRVQPMLIRLVL
jgi:hypothetical protein